MKRYVIIAGVNGAGKSTLYQINDNLKNMSRVNVDEIVREIGDWKIRVIYLEKIILEFIQKKSHFLRFIVNRLVK